MNNQAYAVPNDVTGSTAGSVAGSGSTGHGAHGGGRPTMKDVASRAGVALKTVSRVVNGEPGVTPETARRVLGAIEDLGFRRNESARLLRTGRTATLGFIADNWANPDQAGVYQGLEEATRAHGYLLYAGSADRDPAREERLALAMCARRVDGLVISPTPGSRDYLTAEIEAGVAAVFVLHAPALARTDTVLPDTVLPDTVLPDERGGGRAAITHLIAQGHRRIGFIASRDDQSRNERLLAGYAEAMTAAGLTADPAWTMLDPELPGHPPVTAVFCADRARTEAVLRAQAARKSAADRRAGQEAGQEAGSGRLAIIGFGDLALADVLEPGLTVVSYDPVLIGRTAGELLIRRLADEQAPPRLTEIPVRLIARGSAEFPPAGQG